MEEGSLTPMVPQRRFRETLLLVVTNFRHLEVLHGVAFVAACRCDFLVAASP
jgi:hypothetical protein